MKTQTRTRSDTRIWRVFALLLPLLCCPQAVEAELQLFSRGVMRDIAVTDVPELGELVDTLRFVAAPGEFEPFSLALRSTETGRWRIEATPLALVHDPGEILPVEALEIALLVEGNAPPYGVTDWILQPGITHVQLAANRTERLWLTLHVADSVQAGEYRGRLDLVDAAGHKIAVPLQVQVLNARLDRDIGVHFAVLSTIGPFTQYFKPDKKTELFPETVEFYRELLDHGMTSAVLKSNDWPYRTGEFAGLSANVEAAMAAGLDGPVVWNMQALINAAKGGERYAHYDGKADGWEAQRDLTHLQEIVRTVEGLREEGDWPEMIYYTIDEPGTQTENWDLRTRRMEIMVNSLRVVSQLGVRG
ncbi:MAG: hypothetical protein HN559_28690, partial [Gemmatimonadetes bacterium]|nr:hypothetical protein [Gemmatimonadota bacterium]